MLILYSTSQQMRRWMDYNMSEITIPNAAEMLERTVKPVGGGAQVHVPKTWLGCRVAVVRLEDILGGDARTPQH